MAVFELPVATPGSTKIRNLGWAAVDLRLTRAEDEADDEAGIFPEEGH